MFGLFKKNIWKNAGFSTRREAMNSYGWNYKKRTYAKNKAGFMLFQHDKQFGKHKY